VGDQSRVETTGLITAGFSKPTSDQGFATSYGFGVNTANGVIMSDAAANGSSGNGVLGLYHVQTTGGNGALGLIVDAKDTTAAAGGGGVNGIIVSTDANSNASSEGVSISSVQAGGSGACLGIGSSASNQGTGKEIAGEFSTGGFRTGANSLALHCLDHLGAEIFQVRDDGSVHIKTGTAVVADL
jgi:hypothetical protein